MLHGGDGLEHTDAVPLGEHQVQHQNFGLALCDQAQGLFSVGSGAQDLKVLRRRQCRRKPGTELLRVVCNQNSCTMIHNILS